MGVVARRRIWNRLPWISARALAGRAVAVEAPSPTGTPTVKAPNWVAAAE